MKESSNVKIRYVVMCIAFVVALVVIAVSVSYAYFRGVVTRANATETKIKTATFNITSNLPTRNAIEVYDLPLINSDEIATKSVSLDFNVVSDDNRTGGDVDIYLTDIEISPDLIDTLGSFKWQLLEGSTVVASGSFNDIETNGVASTTHVNSATVLYFDKYYLKREIPMAQTETKNYTFRIYLLNDDSANQIALAGKTFKCKVSLDGYSLVNNN